MEIIVRATVIFAVLLVLTRGMKRRALADMAPFELLLLVTLGDIIQQGITQEDYSVTGAVLAVSTFAFWITVLTYVTWRWRRAADVIDGVPLVIVEDGTLIESTLKAERLPVAEVLEAARQNGIDSLDKVRLAILETTGRISFIEHDRPGSPPPR
ncbi:MAG: YetF domain-containing protein [Ilumatobacteraceae bacterium]